MNAEPVSEERCALCGELIDVQPGESFMASTDGRVWHMGCSKHRTPPATEMGIETLVERLKIAFWASLTNANAGMKWLDYDSMEEMISAAWVGFEQPAIAASTRTPEAVDVLVEALDMAAGAIEGAVGVYDQSIPLDTPEEFA